MLDAAFLDLHLPDNARVDLAYIEHVQLGAEAWPLILDADGAAIDVYLYVHFNLVTDATVANRRPRLLWRESASGTILQQWPSLATVAASGLGLFFFSLSAQYAADDGTRNYSRGIPLWPILPGQSLVVDVENGVAGDALDDVRLSVIRIPTGPALPGLAGLAPILSPREIAA